jgi:hypothetical protein
MEVKEIDWMDLRMIFLNWDMCLGHALRNLGNQGASMNSIGTGTKEIKVLDQRVKDLEGHKGKIQQQHSNQHQDHATDLICSSSYILL